MLIFTLCRFNRSATDEVSWVVGMTVGSIMGLCRNNSNDIIKLRNTIVIIIKRGNRFIFTDPDKDIKICDYVLETGGPIPLISRTIHHRAGSVGISVYPGSGSTGFLRWAQHRSRLFPRGLPYRQKILQVSPAFVLVP